MRPSFRKRGYSPEWDALAVSYKQQNLWCISCWGAGVRRRIEIVDHIVPVIDAPERLLDLTNLQGACRWCHATLKVQLEARWRAGKIKIEDLDLRSDVAHALRRKLQPPPLIGADGYPVSEAV